MPRGPEDRATVSAKIDLGRYLAQYRGVVSVEPGSLNDSQVGDVSDIKRHYGRDAGRRRPQ